MKTVFKVLKPGHAYALFGFENQESVQHLNFIDKEVDKKGELKTVKDGTTNEALTEVLIDRLKFLNEKMPCRENALAITKFEEALFWLESRTKRRVEQDVEGTSEPGKGDSVKDKPVKKK